jgi:hypothetical protein
MPETQAEYEARCLIWGENSYRPWRGANAASSAPQSPASPASGADWVAWLDTNAGANAPQGYRAWKNDPNNSGNSSPPPPRPRDKN